MKTIASTIASTIAALTIAFSAPSFADSVYHGLSDGNGDLGGSSIAGVTATQPGVGDVDLYGLLDDGNGDLFSQQAKPQTGDAGDIPSFYGDWSGNPDLSAQR